MSARIGLASLCVLIAAACGHGGQTAVKAVEPSSDLAAQPTTIPTADVPADIDPSLQVEGSPAADANGGVWFFAWSTSKSLYRWDEVAQKLSSVVLPLSDAPPAAEPAIAVDDDGSAWLGINDALVHVSPTLDILSITPAGEFPGVAEAQKYRPDDLAKVHPIIAVSAYNGHVAIAAEAASSVRIFGPDGKASDIALPPDSAASGLAFSSDTGRLAVGLIDYATQSNASVMVVDPTGDNAVVNATLKVEDASFINAWPGTGSFLVGSLRPDVVGKDGKVTPIQLPVPMDERSGVTGAVALSPTIVAVATTSRVVEVDTSAGAPPQYAKPFPPGACGPAALPPGSESTQTTDAPMCISQRPKITSDAQGRVWYVLTAGGRPSLVRAG